MSTKQVLLFFCGVFAALGLLWLITPAQGVNLGVYTLRFASYERALEDARQARVDVDSVLRSVDARFQMDQDTLRYYEAFFHENPDRIYLPGDDVTFFDTLFQEMEQSAEQDRTVRILHFGDSQIEVDRISQDLRQGLQERFGGIGTGYFPAVSNVPSASINRPAGGGFKHYTMYGDSTTSRASHRRYGMLAQVVQLSGSGTVNLKASGNKNIRERVKEFSSVSVLYGHADKGLEIKVSSDTVKASLTTRTAASGVTLQTWQFSRPVRKAMLRFKGRAEIYGISADGDGGVTVDNVPLRGSSGTVFTRIDSTVMRECLALADTRLIILQFGGNVMPVVSGVRNIEQYQEQMEQQISYFHEVAPEAKILLIGPSDMGKSVNGRIVTWPRLPQMVDSLKATALRNDAAYWDLYHMMGGENSMVEWARHSPPLAGADYIHFTPAGAREAGEALTRSFLTYYDFYQLRKK
ncbi:MAG: hypothetical protein J6M23_07940 [Bacteroidales bacterium]|nr:hypothetical protein [Bacteroidales bacterium]